jgi:hypothetical protein
MCILEKTEEQPRERGKRGDICGDDRKDGPDGTDGTEETGKKATGRQRKGAKKENASK